MRAFAEEILFHFRGDECARFRIERIEAVLVDQHGLMHEPCLPGFLRDMLVDALAELAGPWSEREALGFAMEFYAVDIAGHGLSSSVSSSLRTGAGRPSTLNCPCEYQSRSGSSATRFAIGAPVNKSGVTCR